MVLGGRCVSGADIPGLMQKRLGRAQPSSVAGRGGSWRRRTRRSSPRDVWRADFQSAVLAERIFWAGCKSGWAEPNPPVSRGVAVRGGGEHGGARPATCGGLTSSQPCWSSGYVGRNAKAVGHSPTLQCRGAWWISEDEERRRKANIFICQGGPIGPRSFCSANFRNHK
jgi:hypothetical protein